MAFRTDLSYGELDVRLPLVAPYSCMPKASAVAININFDNDGLAMSLWHMHWRTRDANSGHHGARKGW